MVPDAVTVDLAAGRPTRIETDGGLGHIDDRHVVRQVSVQPAQEAIGRDLFVQIHGGNLPKRVHPCIGAPRAANSDGTVQHLLECFLDALLDGAIRALALPAAKIGAVVFDHHAQRALGWGGRFVHQNSNIKPADHVVSPRWSPPPRPSPLISLCRYSANK